MTVGELGRRMTHSEFAEWVEMEGLEPIPDRHLIGAQICATTAQCFSARKVKISDFLPQRRSRSPKSAAELRTLALQALFGSQYQTETVE